MRAGVQTQTCIPMFTAALHSTAPRRKQPKCPPADTPMWSIHTGDTTQPQRGSVVTRCETDGPQKHPIKCKKPVATENMLQDSLSVKYPERANSQRVCSLGSGLPLRWRKCPWTRQRWWVCHAVNALNNVQMPREHTSVWQCISMIHVYRFQHLQERYPDLHRK